MKEPGQLHIILKGISNGQPIKDKYYKMLLWYIDFARENSKKELIEEFEKINLFCLDKEQKHLEIFPYPMEKYNVSICLNNLSVEINKKLQELKSSLSKEKK